MSSLLYGILNKTLEETVGNLANCFKDKESLQECLKKLKALLAKSEDALYVEIVKPDMPQIVKHVHAKDETFFDVSTHVGALLGGREIYMLLKEDEVEAYWRALKGVVQWGSILGNAGETLGDFEEIAHMFVSKNKTGKVDPSMFTQLFQDKDIANKLCQTFATPDKLKTMLKSVKPIFEGMGLTQQLGEVQEAEEKEEAEAEAEEESNTSASYVRKRKKKRKKKKKKQQGLSQLVDMVENIEINDDDIKDLHESVQQTLSADEGLDIGAMMKSLDIRAMMNGDMSGLQKMMGDLNIDEMTEEERAMAQNTMNMMSKFKS